MILITVDTTLTNQYGQTEVNVGLLPNYFANIPKMETSFNNPKKVLPSQKDFHFIAMKQEEH